MKKIICGKVLFVVLWLNGLIAGNVSASSYEELLITSLICEVGALILFLIMFKYLSKISKVVFEVMLVASFWMILNVISRLIA